MIEQSGGRADRLQNREHPGLMSKQRHSGIAHKQPETPNASFLSTRWFMGMTLNSSSLNQIVAILGT